MADVKFDIEVTGIKELRQAADSFQRLGKVSSQLSAQYKPLGAQTQRLVAENNRYARVKKQLAAAVAQGIITEKEATRALQESLRVSRERILTDRTLIDQAKKRAKAAEENRKETERLVKAYAPARVAANLYKNKVQEIDQAEKRGIISKQEAAQALSLLTKEYYDFTQGVATGGNQFAKFNVETYRANQRLKRFTSTGLQQAGYQIGDFAVQVQAGTNVAVAFGQQMSQLLGIFGAGGALAGAAVAIGTAFIAPLIDAQDEVKNLADDMQALFDKLEANKDTAAGLIEGGFAGPLERARQTAIDVLEVFNEIDRREAKQSFAAGVIGISDYLDKELQAATIKSKGGIAVGGKILAEGTTTRGRAGTPQERQEAEQLRAEIVAIQTSILELSRLSGDELAAGAVDLANQLSNSSNVSGNLLKKYKELLETSGLLEINNRRITAEQAKQTEQAANRTAVEKEFVAEAIRKRDKAEKAQLDRRRNLFAQTENALTDSYLDGVRTRLKGEAAERAASEKAQMARRRQIFGQAEDEFSKAYIQGVANRLKEEAAKEQTAYDAQIERNRQAFAKLEQDKVNAHAEGVRKRLAEEDKLRKQQERADANQLQANQILELRNDLLAVEAKYGKESKQYREEAVYVEGQIAAIRARAKGVSEDLVNDAILLAREAENNKFNITDAADEAKLLAAALKDAEKAMSSLINFGDSLEKKLAQAKAEAVALKLGLDVRTAKDVAGLRFQAAKEYEDAFTTATDSAGQISAALEYGKVLELINKLEKAGYDNAAKKDSLKDKSIKSTQDEIDKLYEAIMVERTRIKVGEEEARQLKILQDLRRFNADADIKLTEKELKAAASKIAAAEAYNRRLQEQKDKYEELADFIGDEFEEAFMSILDGTKSAKEAFRDMARAIVAELYKVLVIQRLVNAAKMAFPFANGGVFQNGNVVPFANGGVVGSPTYFPMSGGRTGLMGEAGPEAIMPLKRGKNGKLGVVAEGGGETVVVNNSFNFAANGDDSVKKIIAQSVPQITEAAKAGVLDARKRGGQFRKVFG